MKIISFTVLLMFYSYACADGRSLEANLDPWNKINKVTHRFNDTADKYVLKPMAKGYVKIAPRQLRQIIDNFFGNLGDVNNGVNNLLQGKTRAGASDFLRLAINSTIGIGGLFDPASKLGLVKHIESFAQTLSVWGVPRGPYLVIPFFGPSTLTDALLKPLDPLIDPLRYLYPVTHRNALYTLRVVEGRAGLLAAENIIFGDRYIFLRDTYLQRRNHLVLDGEVEDEFDDF